MTPTWSAPSVERPPPGRTSGEREALTDWLDFHRHTLLMKCAGLTAEQLKLRPVAPSRLSLLGLVRHMTDVERLWFRMTAAGEDVPFVYWRRDNRNVDFEDIEGADPAVALETFRRECEAAGAAVAGRPLDDVVPGLRGNPDQTRNIRWIYVHMIEEYARHNGHADLLRESVDGATGI
jgi:uncharacterized damage-inducible protein DinB